MNARTPKYSTKEYLGLAKDWAQILSLSAVPIIIALAGWHIQKRIADENTKSQYVQIALGILREPPKTDDSDARALRQWAIDIIARYAPIKLPPQSREALLLNRLELRPVTRFSFEDLEAVRFDDLGDIAFDDLGNATFAKCVRDLRRTRSLKDVLQECLDRLRATEPPK